MTKSSLKHGTYLDPIVALVSVDSRRIWTSHSVLDEIKLCICSFRVLTTSQTGLLDLGCPSLRVKTRTKYFQIVWHEFSCLCRDCNFFLLIVRLSQQPTVIQGHCMSRRDGRLRPISPVGQSTGHSANANLMRVCL